MNECYGNKFILNGELHSPDSFDKLLIYEGDSVYEVIRMTRGTPVFFNDHMERLADSVKYQGEEMLAGAEELRRSIINLTRADRKKETNLKIVFNYNRGVKNWLVYFIEPIYPSPSQYQKGVKGILVNAERIDPGSKVINHKLRSEIYHRLILEGAYEALLVNGKKLITEGSRSNIFFVRGRTLFTAPDTMILKGITRKYILDICEQQNIRVKLKCVGVNEIAHYDSVFMTGTSPTILPFCCIDDIFFNAGLPLIGQLRKLYLMKAEESMISFRSE